MFLATWHDKCHANDIPEAHRQKHAVAIDGHGNMVDLGRQDRLFALVKSS